MRKQSRIVFRSIFRCKAKGRANNRLIGYVADVSEGGLKLLCDAPLEAGAVAQLRLAMRNEEGVLDEVEIDARCLWCQENPRSGYHEAGMIIDEPTAAYERWVAGLRRVRKQPA